MVRKISLGLILVALMGCGGSEKTYYASPLSEQRLVVRENYPGKLTNQSCNKYEKGKCEEWDVRVYDLEDENFRRKVNEFRVACRVADKRWRICLDAPGYCRRTLKCVKQCWYWLFSCCEYEEKYIPATEHQYLLDGNTYCMRGL